MTEMNLPMVESTGETICDSTLNRSDCFVNVKTGEMTECRPAKVREESGKYLRYVDRHIRGAGILHYRPANHVLCVKDSWSQAVEIAEGHYRMFNSGTVVEYTLQICTINETVAEGKVPYNKGMYKYVHNLEDNSTRYAYLGEIFQESFRDFNSLIESLTSDLRLVEVIYEAIGEFNKIDFSVEFEYNGLMFCIRPERVLKTVDITDDGEAIFIDKGHHQPVYLGKYYTLLGIRDVYATPVKKLRSIIKALTTVYISGAHSQWKTPEGTRCYYPDKDLLINEDNQILEGSTREKELEYVHIPALLDGKKGIANFNGTYIRVSKPSRLINGVEIYLPAAQRRTVCLTWKTCSFTNRQSWLTSCDSNMEPQIIKVLKTTVPKLPWVLKTVLNNITKPRISVPSTVFGFLMLRYQRYVLADVDVSRRFDTLKQIAELIKHPNVLEDFIYEFEYLKMDLEEALRPLAEFIKYPPIKPLELVGRSSELTNDEILLAYSRSVQRTSVGEIVVLKNHKKVVSATRRYNLHSTSIGLVCKIDGIYFAFDPDGKRHVEAPTMHLLKSKAENLRRGFVTNISFNDVRNDRTGTYGFCLVGTRAFLKEANLQFLHSLIRGYSSWSEVPEDIMSEVWNFEPSVAERLFEGKL